MKNFLICSALALGTSACTFLEVNNLTDPVKRASDLISVTPSETITHAGNGKLSDGRNLNPVLSKSLRTFDTVTVTFPSDTTETRDGLSDYNIFAWRKATKHIGKGEVQCDVGPIAPALDIASAIKIGRALLWLGTIAATYEPVRGRTVVANYDPTNNGRLKSLVFKKGKETTCN